MKRFNKILIFTLILLIVQACGTGQSAFNKGNYYDATIKAVKKLRTKPDSKKSLALIQKSYPLALEYHRQRIDALGASNHPDKFIQIVDTYKLMNNMADEITRCPAALNVLKPVVYYHDQLKKAEQMAIIEQFNSASNLIKTENVNDARVAYQKLKWVKEVSPAFSDIDRQIAIAKDLATFKTIVVHLPEAYTNYKIDSRVFYNVLFDQLAKSGTEFKRFYKPDLAEELQIAPHHIVEVQFIEFSIDALHEKINTKSYQNDSVNIGSYTDKEGHEYPVKGSVKAAVEITEREVMAKGIVSITIKDYQTGDIIQNRKYPGDYIWRNRWATFNGDERALPNDILQLTREKQNMPPSPQDMFMLVSQPILANATSYLKSYYNKR